MSDSPTLLALAYGGVVIDEAGRVLLREPKNHFDYYVYTFPKGRPDEGESPEQAALREVREETGVEAVSVCWVDGGEAEAQLAETTDAKGRARDLAVLAAARAVWEARSGRG